MRLGDRRVATLRGMLRQPRITHAGCNPLHTGVLIAAAAIYPPPWITRKSSPNTPCVFNKSLYSLQLAEFSLAVLCFWDLWFDLCRYAGAHDLSSAQPWRLSPHQCWLDPGGVLGGTFAQHGSQFNLTLMACYSSTVLLFCWLAIVLAAGLILLLVGFGVLSGITIALVIVAMAYCAPRLSQVRLSIPCLSFGSPPLTRYATVRCLCWPVNLRRGLLRSCRHSYHWLLIIEHNGYTSDIGSSAAVIMAGDVVLVFLDTLSQCTNHRAETISKATS